MLPKNIPDEINAELLLSYFEEGSCKVRFCGTHKRNAYNDLLGIEENTDGSLTMDLGRASLYNNLPEMMFHPIDRFDDIPAQYAKERFHEEYEAQKRETENAHKFFAPIDLLLLKLRLSVRDRLEEYVESDKILTKILGDELTALQKGNRFILKTLPFLPICKWIRGNKTLMTLLLRKVFKEEGLDIKVHEKCIEFTDAKPRYTTRLDEKSESIDENDSFYVGNTFDESILVYDIHYWSKEECQEYFMTLIDEVEVYRLFIKDYFMALDMELQFDISNQGEALILSDDKTYNYLNYNTNL